MYIYKFDGMTDKYYNIFHRTSKIRSINVKTITQFVFDIRINDEVPLFKVGDHVHIS